MSAKIVDIKVSGFIGNNESKANEKDFINMYIIWIIIVFNLLAYSNSDFVIIKIFIDLVFKSLFTINYKLINLLKSFF